MKTHKQTKTSDTAVARLLLASVLCLLLCAACLSSYTFAWFSDSVSSTSGRMRSSGECSLSVSVYDGLDTKVATADTQSSATLTCEGEYTVVLTVPKGSSAGYLVLTVEGREYYSESFSQDNGEDRTVSFTLNASTAQDVTFATRWGVHTGARHIEDGEELNIG